MDYPIKFQELDSIGNQQEALLTPDSAAASTNERRFSGSLAKKKLLAKIEPSMLTSAVINGKVSLACDISTATADDSVALILWYKDDSLAPIYTVDARKASSLERAKTSVDPAYTNRANFHMRRKPAQLTLEPVKHEDEGDYRCRVDFKRGRTVNTIISLRVLLLPDDLRIVQAQKPHAKLEGLIGPFNEGSALTLVCLATGGKPRPQISWRRDFNVIDETYQHVNKEGTSNELKIPALSKNHLLSIFTCQATNNNLTAPMQTSITLDLNLKPQEVSLKALAQEPLVVGQTVTFECITHGSRPQATIHWLFQGVRHDSPMSVDQQQTSSRLTLTLQRSFNQQTLTCVAENPRIAQSTAVLPPTSSSLEAPGSLHQSIKLDVHYPPQLSIRLEPPIGLIASSTLAGAPSATQNPMLNNNGENNYNEPQLNHQYYSTEHKQLQEGNDIYLTCQMDANPRPNKPIVWRFNGRVLQHISTNSNNNNNNINNNNNNNNGGKNSSANNMILMNNQSLVLRKVSRHQSGAYTCDATNQHGTNTSKPLDLVIRHAPVCSTGDILLFQASVGQTVTIDCNVIANPSKSVHYSWFQAPNERNLSHWIQREAALDEQIDESSSRLKFKIRDANGFGLVKCKAKNEIGLQQRACLFQMVQAPAPSLRHSCSFAGATSNSIQVNCTPIEHLKTEEFELVNRQQQQLSNSITSPSSSSSSGSDSMGAWLGLDAMRHAQLTSSSHHPSSANDYSTDSGNNNNNHHHQPAKHTLLPSLRLVFPPNWLLAELYKVNNEPLKANQLIAYVVVGAAHQLVNIKAIVEENGLFSSNPKNVYYVFQQQQHSNSSTHSSQPILKPNPFFTTIQQMAPLVEADPSIQLADTFAFTVPNLEPETRYKMLIYGQNLSNKTRDWLVVGGETLNEQASLIGNFRSLSSSSSSSSSSSLAPASLSQQREENNELLRSAFITNADYQPSSTTQTANSSTFQQQQQQQKSIVLRSDSADNSATTIDHTQHQLGQQLSDASGRLLDSAGSWTERVQQLYIYRDYAISYARQKPLLVIPFALVLFLALVFVAAQVSSYLVQAIRHQSGDDNNDASKSSSLSSSCVSPTADLGASGETATGAELKKMKITNATENMRISSANNYESPEKKSNKQHHFQLTSSSEQSYSSSSNGLVNNTNSPRSGLYKLELESTIGNQLELSNEEQEECELQQQQQQQQQHTHHHSLLQQMLYQPCSQRQLVGSLDRRSSMQANNTPIYHLSELQQSAIQLQHRHQDHRHFGSIDRRRLELNSSSFITPSDETHTEQLVSQQQQPPLLISAADLSELQEQNIGRIYLKQCHSYATADDEPLVRGCNQNNSLYSNSTSLDTSEHQHHQQHRARHQRVAFDLSNQCQQQQQQQQHKSTLNINSTANKQHSYLYPVQVSPSVTSCLGLTNDEVVLDDVDVCQQQEQQQQQQRRRIIVSPLVQQQQQQQHEENCLLAISSNNSMPVINGGSAKGSDSGASTSGATADSGHESTPTAETSSGYAHAGCVAAAAAAAAQLKVHRRATNMIAHNQLNCQLECYQSQAQDNSQQKHQQAGNLVMLMELSPGSQESSVVLQSADSIALSGASDSQPCSSSQAVHLHHMHNNHQMATSFGQQQQSSSQKSKNWML